jgi:hypothetical protein
MRETAGSRIPQTFAQAVITRNESHGRDLSVSSVSAINMNLDGVWVVAA